MNGGEFNEPKIYLLLMKLRRNGGCLVRDVDCTEEEIMYARYHGNYTVDRDGFGYLYKEHKNGP